MAGSYSGFDVAQMLNVLQRKAVNVRLTSNDNTDEWTIYVLSDEHGEFEQSGSLFRIVMLAFKPFLEVAKQERAYFAEKFNHMKKMQVKGVIPESKSITITEVGYFQDGVLVESGSSNIDVVLALVKSQVEANITGSSLMLSFEPSAIDSAAGLMKVINFIEGLDYYVYYPSVAGKNIVDAFNNGKILDSELDDEHLEAFEMHGRLIYGPFKNPEIPFNLFLTK